MEKEFVTYAQALTLKELGFDERCLIKSEHTKKCVEKERPGGCQLHNLHCGYPDCTIDKTITPIPLPLKQQVFRWFRETRNLIGLIEGGYDNGKNMFSYVIWRGSFDDWIDTYWDTYEEAENACIDKLIEIAKQKDNG
jgi:hypothetical protein